MKKNNKITAFDPEYTVLGVIVATQEIRRAQHSYIQGRKGAYRAIVKTKGGLTVVEDLGILSGWEFPQWSSALDVFLNFKKGALQVIQFQPHGFDHWVTVFSRTGNKVTTIDTDLLAALKVGHINQNWSKTTLYNQYQYKAVNAVHWECKAFMHNN